MHLRRLLAALLCVVMTVSLLPAGTVTAAAAEDEWKVAYEVDFRGTAGIFEPKAIFGNNNEFNYNVSEDGKSITLKGKAYDTTDPDGVMGQTYWGGIVKGLTANETSRYAITYKVKNNSTKAYSQVALGGWITDTQSLTKYWNAQSTYNAPGTVILGMLNGNTDSVGGSTENKKLLQSASGADRDAQGFIDMKIEYDGPTYTMTLYTKVDGAWQELYVRDIEVERGNRMGIILYSYRSGACNMTYKDVKILSMDGKVASTVEVADDTEEVSLVTGYAEQPKLVTLAEVKPRYGIDRLVTAPGAKAEAVFRDNMDAYLMNIPYPAASGETGGASELLGDDYGEDSLIILGGSAAKKEQEKKPVAPVEQTPAENTELFAVSLKNNLSAAPAGTKSLSVKFRLAIDPKADTPLQKTPENVRLQVTADGVTWRDTEVTFTAEATGERVVSAKDLPKADSGAYLFEKATTIPVYEFSSTEFDPTGVKNIRLVPTGSNGSFRLLSLYVWANTGEVIRVPELGGNLNPEAEKTTTDGVTAFDLYSTDFSNTNSWATNAISYRQSGKEKMNGVSRRYTYFSTSGNLPTTDGQSIRLYSPDMKLDVKQFNQVLVDFTCFRINAQSDPALDMRVGYSTDDGATWNVIKQLPKMTRVTGEGAVDGTGYETYHYSMNLKEVLPAGTIVTNVIVMPYNEKSWYDVRLVADNIDSPKRYDGPMKGSKGAFRMLDFSLTGISYDETMEAESVPVYLKDYDSIVIQTMIDEAVKAGKHEVMIPPINPRNGGDTWEISKVIKVPSNMTLYINNCKLRFYDYSLTHMIENQNAGNQYLANEDQNIHILGIGNAILQGGVHNGIGSHLIKSTSISTWENMMLLLQNVNNFSVQNLRIEESRFWSVVLYYCRNGSVQHMDYHNSRKIQKYNGVEVWEQDSIDVRNGCENILVNDITGRCGDDSVALNAIRPNTLVVHDKHGDIKNITITNIATKLQRHRNNIRITGTNGWKIHDVLIDGVYDTTADFGGYDSWFTVMLGDSSSGYATVAPTQPGDTYNIYIRNLVGCTPYPIGARHSAVQQKHWAYEYDSVSNLYSGTSSSSLLSEGDKKDKIVTPIECEHEWTRELTDTQHLQGLNELAATLEWKGCANCNAVKRPEGYTAEQLRAGSTASAPAANGFTDVAAGSYYYDSVKWAEAQGITGGTTATTFAPHAACTRAQIVTFLWRAAGCPAPAGTDCPFTDVPANAYYRSAVLWAVEQGITGGTTATTFAPNATCTRAQAVTFLHRAAGKPAAASAASFKDVAAGAYYADAVKWAVSEGVTNGTSATAFNPAGTCSRAQIVTFLYRAKNS